MAYLGALLSTITGFPVKSNSALDVVPEKEDEEDSSSDGNHSDKSHTYRPSTKRAAGSSKRPNTRSRHGLAENDNVQVDSLMVCFLTPNGCSKLIAVQLTSSPTHSSNPHLIHLHKMSNPSIDLPLPPEWGQLLRITKLLGEGSTAGVYQGCMRDKILAVKIVEILGPYDGPKQQRLHSEFGIYSCLELAFSTRKLAQRITPQCYGAFESIRLDALIMELHGDSLSKWDDLGLSERSVTTSSLRITLTHSLPASKSSH